MNSINHVLQTADREGYAVPAFNYSDIWELEGIVEAAAEERATVYIASNMRVAETVGLPYLGAMGRTAYEQTGGHIINHLDHSSSVELCKQAVDCGYMSVMIDASMCPLEENIAKTREVVEYAHKYGVVVEAEIGRILGRNVEGTYEGDEYLVQVADAVRMAEETGVDSLAVGIGTAHGFYKEAPRINIQRLVEVNAAVAIPLVLHGGTGVPRRDGSCLHLQRYGQGQRWHAAPRHLSGGAAPPAGKDQRPQRFRGSVPGKGRHQAGSQGLDTPVRGQRPLLSGAARKKYDGDVMNCGT